MVFFLFLKKLNSFVKSPNDPSMLLFQLKGDKKKKKDFIVDWM